MNWQRKFIASVAFLILNACSPDVVNQGIPVDVPVTVPCQAPIVAVPVFATASVTENSSLFAQAQALAATNEQRKGYESQLVAAVKACQ